MTVEINHPLAVFTGAMEIVLELSGAGKVVEACNSLATALEALRAPAPSEFPDGVRHDIHRQPDCRPGFTRLGKRSRTGLLSRVSTFGI